MRHEAILQTVTCIEHMDFLHDKNYFTKNEIFRLHGQSNVSNIKHATLAFRFSNTMIHQNDILKVSTIIIQTLTWSETHEKLHSAVIG